MHAYEQPLIQRVRDFWDARPCNIRHSQIDIDADPEGYDHEVAQRKYFVEPHIRNFAQHARWKDKKVLDLGCGIGTDTVTFAVAGAHVTAVDISPRSIEIARKRAKAYKLPIRFLCGDIEELPHILEPQTFDLVYSFGVLHHTPRPERVIAHLRDHYMGPGSTLKLMLYNRYSWKAFWILAAYGKFQFWRWAELIARHSEAQTGCPITRTYTPELVREMLDGFIIEDLRVDHIFPYRIKDYVKYRYVREWYWRVLPPRWFRWLERHIGWHMLVTTRKES
jgi:2-polyprenyl-3-methyl-5-hydroxy-6-metoxy-1,4-benzoquinol methylase